MFKLCLHHKRGYQHPLIPDTECSECCEEKEKEDYILMYAEAHGVTPSSDLWSKNKRRDYAFNCFHKPKSTNE